MPLSPQRVVLDTNILVRGLLNPRCDSGRILRACEDRRVLVLLSRELLSEYRFVLHDQSLVDLYPELDPLRVRMALDRLMYLGERVQTVRTRFIFSRDRKDEKLITLAIAGMASDLITTDRDLLDLPHDGSVTGRRFRQRLANIAVLEPNQFVKRYGRLLGIERAE